MLYRWTTQKVTICHLSLPLPPAVSTIGTLEGDPDVALSNLRNPHVTLSNSRDAFIPLLNLRNAHIPIFLKYHVT